MSTRSKAEIVRDLSAWLETRIRTMDTGSSTVLYGLLLDALAQAIADAQTQLAYAEIAQGIGDPAEVEQFDLDAMAYNLSLSRKAPQPASGFVTFRRTTVPDATIRIGAEDGTGGIVVGTARDSNGVLTTFRTSSTVFMTTTVTADPITGFYEVSAPIVADQSGTDSNKAAGSILNLVTPVQGVTSVTNKTATTGGKDQESNEELAARMVSKLLGFQPGILEGLRTVALSVAGVEDAAVVGPGDEGMQRSGIGDVDLVIKGSSETAATDVFPYSGPTAHRLENRPATAINRVVSTIGLTLTSLTAGAQFSFSQDAATEERNSVDSNDHLSWVGSNLPNNSADVVVTYVYDALINQIQDAVDVESAHYPAADVLVKRAESAIIDMTFTIVRNTTIDSTSLRNNISTALTNYINGLGLNATIRQSALVALIKGVSGVRSINLPFTKLARRDELGVADIELTPYEYPLLDDQSLTITITTP